MHPKDINYAELIKDLKSGKIVGVYFTELTPDQVDYVISTFEFLGAVRTSGSTFWEHSSTWSKRSMVDINYTPGAELSIDWSWRTHPGPVKVDFRFLDYIAAGAAQNSCQCGAKAIGSNWHSTWCPKYSKGA